MAAARGAVSSPAASPLVPLLPEIAAQVGAFLTQAGVRTKHLLPPLKLAHALLRVARAIPEADNATVATVAAALGTSVEEMRAVQAVGGGRNSVQSLSQKLMLLVAQVQSGGGGGGGNKHKKKKVDGSSSSDRIVR